MTDMNTAQTEPKSYSLMAFSELVGMAQGKDGSAEIEVVIDAPFIDNSIMPAIRLEREIIEGRVKLSLVIEPTIDNTYGLVMRDAIREQVSEIVSEKISAMNGTVEPDASVAKEPETAAARQKTAPQPVRKAANKGKRR